MQNLKYNITKVWVGVDVAKDYLDIYINPTEKSMHISNTTDGLRGLVKKLSNLNVGQIVLESSGGYEQQAKIIFQKAGHAVWIVDPKRIKSFRESKGIKAKTDKIDAKMIALFASQEAPSYEQSHLSDDEVRIAALTKRRCAIISMIINEKKRLQQEHDIDCQRSTKRIIRNLEKEVTSIDEKREALVKKNVVIQKKADIMQTMVGVGQTTAYSLLSLTPELGKIGNKQISSLIGVAPNTKQSGKYINHATVGGGRSMARRALYMAALTASRSNPSLRNFYNKLRAKGKSPKKALVAVMRKMIVTLNAMLRKEETWVNYA